MTVRAPASSACLARAATARASKAAPATAFQLEAPVMQKSQRRSHPPRATAKVGMSSSSSRHLDLRGKAAGLRPGMTRAPLAGQPVDPAMMRAKVAACEQPARGLRPLAGNGGAIRDARLQRAWFQEDHSSSRLILSEATGRLWRARLTFQRKER